MKGKVEYAVISLCEDLTDPRAKSRPVALIGLGHVDEGRGFVFFVSRNEIEALRATTDELQRKILSDFPRYLTEAIPAGIRKTGPDRFLAWLHDEMRNSLHISSIEEKPVSVEGPRDLPGKLLELFDESVGSKKGRSRKRSGEPEQLPTVFFDQLAAP